MARVLVSFSLCAWLSLYTTTKHPQEFYEGFMKAFASEP